MKIVRDFLGEDIKTLAKALRKFLPSGAANVNVVSAALSAETANRISAINAISAVANTASLASDVGRISINVSALSSRLDTVSALASNAQSIANALSVRADTISNNVSVEVSARNALSVIVSNLNSAHNTLSVNHVSLISDVGRISLNLSAVSTRMDAISVLASNAQSIANAASIVAANATSIANIVSAAHISLVSDVGRISTNHVSLVSDLGRISVNVSAISTKVDVISQQVSVLSAGIGGVQMKVVTNTQTLSAATKISGLSMAVAANGVYQIDGLIIHAMSVVSSFGFAISTSAATFTNAAYRWIGNLSVLSTGTGTSGITNTFTGIGYGNESGIGAFTYSALAGTAVTNMQTELRGVLTISTTAGSLQLKAKGGSGNDLLIKQGSYLRAYKIG